MKPAIQFLTISILLVLGGTTSFAASDNYQSLVVKPQVAMFVNNKESKFIEKKSRHLERVASSQEGPKDDPLATFALIFGVASIIGIVHLTSLIIAPFGIFLSLASLSRIKKYPDKWKGKKKALWGMFLSIIGLALSVLWLWYLVLYMFD